MKQLKTILAILGILSIGFTGGFFTHRYAAKQTIDKVRQLSFAKGFQNRLLEKIEVSDEQRAQIDPIVKEYGGKMAQLVQESRMKRKKLVDNMHEEIKPYLSEEQIKKLEEFYRRFRERKPRDPKMRKRRPHDKERQEKRKNRPPREKIED